MFVFSRLVFLVMGLVGVAGAGTCHAVTSAPEAVEMFQAWDDHRIDVRYVALDPSKGNLMIENLGTEPIVIRLPRAFAARPVASRWGANPVVMRDFDTETILAQFGGGPLVGGRGGGPLGGQPGGGQAGGGAQNVGGNFQGGGQGIGGQGFGGQGIGGQGRQIGGFMRIPPGKTLRRSAVTVCLNHGRPDPRPAIEYRIVRLDQCVDDPVLAEICANVGSSALDSASGQAAAWNRTDSMDWETLRTMPAHQSRYRAPRSRFTAEQIDSAQAFVNAAMMGRPPTARASGQPRSEKSERPYRSEGDGKDGTPESRFGFSGGLSGRR